MTTKVQYTFDDDVSAKLAKLDRNVAGLDKHFLKAEQSMHGLGGRGMRGLGDSMSKFNITGGKTEAMLSGISNAMPGLAGGAEMLINPYTAAGAAVVGLGVGLKKSVDYANEWERTMAKVNVTAELSQAELGKLGERLRQLSMRYATDLQTVPDTFNDIISGVGDVEQSMDILDKSLKAADAGFTDVKIASNAAVNVMNAVGNTTAQETFDVMFATLNKGKAEFTDIANYLPKVIPYSNQLGLSFKETSAAFALMTAKGQTVEQTTMLLQNAFVALADPTKRQNLEKVVKVFDHGKVRPFVDIIGDLHKKFVGLSDQQRIVKMGQLGLDAQAASAFSVLMQNADDFREFNDVVQNSSKGVGALNKAYQDSANSTRNWDVAMNMLKGAWLWIGQQVKPIWDGIIGKVVDFFKWIKALEDRTHIFGTAFQYIGKILKVAWDAVSLPFKVIWGVISRIWGLADKMWQKLNGGADKSVSLFTKLATILGDVYQLAGYVMDALDHILSGEWSSLGTDWEHITEKLSTFGNTISDAAQKGNGKTAGADYYALMRPYLTPEGQKQADAMMAAAQGKKSDMPAGGPRGGLPAGDGKSDKQLAGVASSGPQVRNVTLVIQKMVGAETIHTTNISGDKNLRRELEALLVGAARDAEITLAN